MLSGYDINPARFTIHDPVCEVHIGAQSVMRLHTKVLSFEGGFESHLVHHLLVNQ